MRVLSNRAVRSRRPVDGERFGRRHSDVQAGFGWEAKTTTRHLKVAFYLDDELDAETGALRVIVSAATVGLGRDCCRDYDATLT